MTSTTTAPRTYEPHGLRLKSPAWLLLILPALVTCLLVLFLVAEQVGYHLAGNHP